MVSIEDRLIALEYYALALTWAAEETAPGTAEQVRQRAGDFVRQLEGPYPRAADYLQGMADTFAAAGGLPAND